MDDEQAKPLPAPVPRGLTQQEKDKLLAPLDESSPEAEAERRREQLEHTGFGHEYHLIRERQIDDAKRQFPQILAAIVEGIGADEILRLGELGGHRLDVAVARYINSNQQLAPQFVFHQLVRAGLMQNSGEPTELGASELKKLASNPGSTYGGPP